MFKSNFITFTDEINAKKGVLKPIKELPLRDINSL